ncbi:MAG: FtsX-like permease family protein [Defluviitaleaceae bacterium]|nr:FtsX-like permease family protein [Defluviitaleaceae bacterium]
MIDFLLRKMRKNKWMMICLLVGNILLVGIVSATPLYTQATMERILQQNLRQLGQETGRHPAIMDLSLNFTTLQEARILPAYYETRDTHVQNIPEAMGIPILDTIQTYTMSNWHLVPDAAREPHLRARNIALMGTDRLYDNVSIVYGRLPSSTIADSNVIEALASEAVMVQHHLLVNENLTIGNVNSPYGPQYVRIVGIYEFKEGSETYWSTVRLGPTAAMNTLIIPNDIVRAFISDSNPVHYRIRVQWHHILDYSGFSARHADRYTNVLSSLSSQFNAPSSAWNFSTSFGNVLQEHMVRTAPLAITLWVLQVPIYIMLAFYIYMVSRQILQLEQNEISVLKSRGVSRLQLMVIYALQGLFVSIVSLPAGILLGVGICHLLGASSGFLYLVQRAALTVQVTPMVFLYAGLAMVLSFLTMFIPVISFSRVTIVEHKQKKRGQAIKKALWQRFYLDVLFFGAALYGLHTFNTQREVMAAMVRETASVDPLLFISSSLFIIGAGLFILRIFPYFVKLIYVMGRRFWSPQTYAALLRVIRSSGEEQFIMIFLVFTMAIGIFSAHAARTINTNNDHRIKYMAGADLVFREFWRSNMPTVSPEVYGIRVPDQVIYFEPDFHRFTGFAEVESMTRVQHQIVNSTRVRASQSTQGVSQWIPPDRTHLASGIGAGLALHHARTGGTAIQFMAIETNTFGQTIWFRDDLLRIHINHFLNVLAENPGGVLLSTSFNTVYDYGLGDLITVRNSYGHTAMLEVVGFVDYWPGYAPLAMDILQSGEMVMANRFLAVANLGYIQSLWGVLPYQVWMRTNTPTNQFFYDFSTENELQIVEFTDKNAIITESRSDPILQGINGVLTVSFIVTLLICFAGFLLYWVLSIRGRMLQFGIFRAMGMSMYRIIALLINEQVLITFTAIGIGAAVGITAARLFVPLIQISYTAAQQVVPLMVVIQARDYRNLFIVISIMIILCLCVIGIFITRMKVTQALKLGED